MSISEMLTLIGTLVTVFSLGLSLGKYIGSKESHK